MKDNKTNQTQINAYGVKTSLNEEIIYMSVGMYNFFRSNGKAGLDAKTLWEHLQYLSKYKQTQNMRINLQYLKNGLGWGEDRTKKARTFLSKANLIEYTTEKNSAGQFSGQYIKLKHKWDNDSLREWLDNPNKMKKRNTYNSPEGQKTTPRKTTPLVAKDNYRFKVLLIENLPQLAEQGDIDSIIESLEQIFRDYLLDKDFQLNEKEISVIKVFFKNLEFNELIDSLVDYVKNKEIWQIKRFHAKDLPDILNRAIQRTIKDKKKRIRLNRQTNCPVCETFINYEASLNMCTTCGLEHRFLKNQEEIESQKQWYQDNKNR